MEKTLDKKTAYNVAYSKATYHRVPLDVRKEDLESYRSAASADGMAFNVWIKELMAQRCGELGISIPSREKKESTT